LKAKNANLIFLLVTFWLWLRVRYNTLSTKRVAAYITRQKSDQKTLQQLRSTVFLFQCRCKAVLVMVRN